MLLPGCPISETRITCDGIQPPRARISFDDSDSRTTVPIVASESSVACLTITIVPFSKARIESHPQTNAIETAVNTKETISHIQNLPSTGFWKTRDPETQTNTVTDALTPVIRPNRLLETRTSVFWPGNFGVACVPPSIA